MREAETAVAAAKRRATMVARLGELALQLAEAAAARALALAAPAAASEAPATPPSGARCDPELSFNKLAQTVRRCVVLEARLTEEHRKREKAFVAERQRRDSSAWDAYERAISSEIKNTLQHVISETHGHENEAFEWVDSGEFEHLLPLTEEYEDHLSRPVGETVARLCRELGLDPEWIVERDGVWFGKHPLFSMTVSSLLPPKPWTTPGATSGACPHEASP